MPSAEWDRILEVFHAAREKAGSERAALLDAACGEGTPLRKAVEELLREDAAADGFLSQPVFESLVGEFLEGSIAPGQRFGRYVIGELLGRGGMGEVWSARDTDLDRAVALKFLSPKAIAFLDTTQIRREAKAASALNHPNIVTIHEVVQSESTFAIVMELVEGTPLRQLAGEPLPPVDVLHVGSQIARALAAAHGGGIVHGDIKPENVILRRDRYVKLLDFGLARKLNTEGSGVDSPGLGTLRYLSPEQARGELLTPASDVFSLGLVLYELATGRHAFPADSPLATAQAILSDEARPPVLVNPGIPAHLNSLIRTMLAPDPTVRPSAEQVAYALEAPSTPHGSLRLWPPFLCVAVLLAICFGVWWWRQARDSGRRPTFRQITTLVPENRATAAAISPNGKLAAYANVDGIFVRNMRSGDLKALPSPADYVVDRLAWFSDNRRLVAGGFSTATYIPGIWLISDDGSPPRLLRAQARCASPSPDGTQVVFITAEESQIWVTDANGDDARLAVPGADSRDRLKFVLWSADGHKLFFQRRHRTDRDTVTFESVTLPTGNSVVINRDPWMSSASALHDGRIVFLRWDNDDFSSSHQLWEVKTSLATGAFLEKPRKIAEVPVDNTTLLGVSVSADGKRMIALRRSHQNTIFVGEFDRNPPRITNVHRLTLDERINYPHAWTADSRSVIFESDRNDNFDLFIQDVSRRTPKTLVATPLTEILPQLSPDGRYVLYAARPLETERPWYYKPHTYKLMRVPVTGGTPAAVAVRGPLDEFRCALGAGTRCVLRVSEAGYRAYYDLDPVKGQGRELARSKSTAEYLGDWDVSPDGAHVAIPNHDAREARIRILPLEPSPNEEHEREVVLAGVTNLRGLVWAADGDGWFVSVDTTVGNRLLYVYLDGHYRSLGDIQGWAVPSPDGRRVAFVDRTTASNAWLIERH